jgi:hypothetical protein
MAASAKAHDVGQQLVAEPLVRQVVVVQLIAASAQAAVLWAV